MESCKYHPDIPFNFQCNRCHENFCTDCVDHSVADEARCFHCASLLNVRVTEDNVEPLYKHLEAAFRYPLNSTAMTFVIGLSVANTVLALMPLGGLVGLLAFIFCSGLAVNYSFLCLRATAEGEMTPPNLSDAVAGSFSILFRLFAMLILIGLGVNAIDNYLGSIAATLAMIILFLGIPAIMMAFAMTDSILEAIDPFMFVRLMTTLGISYLVLLMFMFIMVSSVSLLSSIIGHERLVLSTILQSSVSYYYSMVTFHLMGYLLYQYQDKLGITSDADDALLPHHSPADVAMAHANIHLKEGNYKNTVEVLKKAVSKEPNHARLWQRYFDVLFRLGDKKELNSFADHYLNHLVEIAQHDRLLNGFKKLRLLLPDYMPNYAHLRFQLARQFYGSGDFKAAVLLINGLNKKFPDFEQLIPAYSLMAQALTEIPNMENQAAKCRQIVAHLKAKHPEATVALKEPVVEKNSRRG